MIGQNHKSLINERVEFVFMSKTPNSKGRALWGRAKKMTGLQAALANPGGLPEHFGDAQEFFVIEISEEVWVAITDEQREALLDHELAHCGVEYDDHDNKKLVMYAHDLEEFNEIVERHGAWKGDVKRFGEKLQARQMKLPEEEPEKEPEKERVGARA